MMKLFEIEAVVLGERWEYNKDCPPEWINSGVYDVKHEYWQPVKFTVAAEVLEEALAAIARCCEDSSVFYDPDTVKVRDDEDDNYAGDIVECDDGEVVEGRPRPDRYGKEAC